MYTRQRLSEEKGEMVDRLMHVVELWLEAQLTRLEALDGGRKAASLRCARCRAPFHTDEGRRRHLRAEPLCTVRDVRGLEVGGGDDVLRVPLGVKGEGQCEYLQRKVHR